MRNLIEKMGGKIREYPNEVIATYGNLRVETRLAGNNIETVISGLPGTPTIRGVLRRANDGNAEQTIFLGPAPVMTVKYAIPYTELLSMPLCIIKEIPTVILWSLMLLVLGVVTLPFGGIVAIVNSILALVLAPVWAFLLCIVK